MGTASRWRRVVTLALSAAVGALSAALLSLGGRVLESDATEEPARLNCPVGFFYERLSGQCCVQDRATLPANGKIGYTGNSLCEDGYVAEYEQRATTDGLGPPGCPNYTSFAFLVACSAPGEDADGPLETEPAQPAVPAQPEEPAQPVEPAQPTVPEPADTAATPGDDALGRVAGALTDGSPTVPDAGTTALAGLVGGAAGLMVGAAILASAPSRPVPTGGDARPFWDEARRIELEGERKRVKEAYDEFGRRLEELREALRDEDMPSFDATLQELVGLVITLAGAPGMSDLPSTLFGAASMGWGSQTLGGELVDAADVLSRLTENRDLTFERLSFIRGQLAGQLLDLDRQIEVVMDPQPRPDLSKPANQLTTEEAEQELARARRYRSGLEAAAKSWDGTAPASMKTGPSLPELLDLQNRLNETLTKYGRWMQNLPADEKELEEFAESFAWLDGTRSLVGGVGTLATAAGLMGVSAPVTAAVSAGSGGYTVGQAMKGYFQTAKLAQQREIMRTMMGNAQHLAGVVQQQIASGSAQQDAVFTDFQRADQHVRALEHHLGLRR